MASTPPIDDVEKSKSTKRLEILGHPPVLVPVEVCGQYQCDGIAELHVISMLALGGWE